MGGEFFQGWSEGVFSFLPFFSGLLVCERFFGVGERVGKDCLENTFWA